MGWLQDSARFLGDMFHHWVGKMTGFLSVILALAPVIAPHFFEGHIGLIHNRGVWWIASALSFVIASRLAWDQQRGGRLEAETQLREVREELADRYPRLKGELKLGYLNLGAHCYKGLLYNSHGPCVLTLYLEIVNHSKEIAIPHLPPSLSVRINGREYPGEYVIPEANRLRVNDSNLKGDCTILDLFSFSMGGLGQGVLQKGYLRGGWLMFNLPEDSQDQLDGYPNIAGDVTVTIKDTLGGEHTIGRHSLEFGLNKIGFRQP